MELVEGGQVPAAVVAKMASYENPAQTAPSAPVLLVHGTEDEAVPYFASEILAGQIAGYGVPVTFQSVVNANHDDAVTQTAVLVADWIATRFT